VDLKNQKLAPLKEHAVTMRRLVSEAATLKAEITTLERRLPPSTTESRSVSAINSEIEGLEMQRTEVRLLPPNPRGHRLQCTGVRGGYTRGGGGEVPEKPTARLQRLQHLLHHLLGQPRPVVLRHLRRWSQTPASPCGFHPAATMPTTRSTASP